MIKTKKTTSKPASSSEAKPPDFNQKVEQSAEELLKGCSEVRVRINWFGTSAKVDDDIALEMLKSTDADRKAVSISKRLLASKHEALVAIKEARKAIDEHVKGWTIPMLALRAGAGFEGTTRKDAGIRLIQKKDMAAFDARLQYLINLLNTAALKLQEALPAIKDDDKERLGRLYRDSDYPQNVANLIGCEVSYKPVGTDIDWENLCPEIYKRERNAARQRFEAVVETAAVEFASRFIKYVSQVVDQLGNRVRLNPDKNAATEVAAGADGKPVEVNVTDAEVLTILRHTDEPDEVPEGYLMLQLRLAKNDKKGRSTEVWLHAPITEEHYHKDLRPYETSERRKLYESTVDHLKAELDAFINIGSMLGPYKSVIEDSVTKVKEMLSKASTNLDTAKISEALREGNYFRNEMKTALEGVSHAVSKAIGEVKESRRTIKKSLIGKV